MTFGEKIFEIVFLSFYRFAFMPLTLSVLLIGALFSKGKLREFIKMRLPMRGKNPWLDLPKGKRPIWFHCASGEFEYAKPVIRLLKKTRPDIPVLVTYFSPSYKNSVESYDLVDYSSPIPWDLPGPIGSFLHHHNPRALLIARTDLWPELLYQAKRREIPTLLFSATRGEITWKQRWFTLFFSWLYSKVDEINCVSEEDQRAFHSVAPKTATSILGDTRYDQVIERLKQPKPLNIQLLSPAKTKPCLVAGSTWPEDETELLKALPSLIRDQNWQVIIVPHEPDSTHLSHLAAQIESCGLHHKFYTTANDWKDGEVLIIDKVGILAELYQLANLAYVGGSFKKSVHSVMEPLACGCITVVGPYHHNNREALEFATKPLSSQFKMVNPVMDSDAFSKLLIGFNDVKGQWPEWKVQIKKEVERKTGASQQLLERIQAYF